MLRETASNLIEWYQIYIRTMLPCSCRYTPSCSEYAKQAVVKYGFFKGALKAGRRLLCCQPFSKKSGYYPLT